jgi:hypothetical protein
MGAKHYQIDLKSIDQVRECLRDGTFFDKLACLIP